MNFFRFFQSGNELYKIIPIFSLILLIFYYRDTKKSFSFCDSASVN